MKARKLARETNIFGKRLTTESELSHWERFGTSNGIGSRRTDAPASKFPGEVRAGLIERMGGRDRRVSAQKSARGHQVQEKHSPPRANPYVLSMTIPRGFGHGRVSLLAGGVGKHLGAAVRCPSVCKRQPEKGKVVVGR
jgi:hypothetical protein